MSEVTVATGDSDENDGSKGRGAQILVRLGRRRRGNLGAGPKIPGYVIPPGSRIGEGSFSEVYRARDLTVARDVAIKILRQGEQPDEIQQDRMDNEARALARLQGSRAGDHIVQIYNRSRSTDDRHYLVLELIEDGSLADRLREGGPLLSRAAASMVKTIAEVVQVVHELGIIHRDLKPSNVLLAPGDRPKLTDFGLAKFADIREGLSIDGQVLGTLEYMPPEQATGRHAEVDATSDLYSIGAILYECLTGRPPFRGPNIVETLDIIRSDKEPILPEQLVPSVPRDLSTICLKCLNKKKDARYPSAAALAEDLGHFLEGRPINARRAGPLERLGKLIRRNQRVSALIALVIASVVVGVAATLLYAKKAGEQQVQAELYAQKAKKQQVRADKNAEVRFHALEKVLSAISGDRLRRAGQRPLQVELIGDLLPQFEEVLKIEGDDPATKNLQGLAWTNLAAIRRDLGKLPEAEEAARNGEAIFRTLLVEPEFADESSIGLGTALSYKGTMLGLGGKFDEAIAAFGEAARLIEPYAVEDAPPLLERMGHIQNNLGNCLRFGGGNTPESIEAADRYYREAVVYFGRGARTLRTCRDWQARTMSNLALFVEDAMKRPVEGIELARQASDLAKGLVRDFPKDIDSRESLGTCLTNLAELRMNHGNAAETLSMFQETLAIFERLSAQVPDSFDFRWNIAMAVSNIGQALSFGSPSDWEKAAEHFRHADLLYRALIKEDDKNEELIRYFNTNLDRLKAIEAKLASPH